MSCELFFNCILYFSIHLVLYVYKIHLNRRQMDKCYGYVSTEILILKLVTPIHFKGICLSFYSITFRVKKLMFKI
jgi:hypothetical protein